MSRFEKFLVDISKSVKNKVESELNVWIEKQRPKYEKKRKNLKVMTTSNKKQRKNFSQKPTRKEQTYSISINVFFIHSMEQSMITSSCSNRNNSFLINTLTRMVLCFYH